ncbi:hypothetical protein ADL26_11640, partial [Thermoactinomyces vulgaris]
LRPGPGEGVHRVIHWLGEPEVGQTGDGGLLQQRQSGGGDDGVVARVERGRARIADGRGLGRPVYEVPSVGAGDVGAVAEREPYAAADLLGGVEMLLGEQQEVSAVKVSRGHEPELSGKAMGVEGTSGVLGAVDAEAVEVGTEPVS